jgi:hypothetical protein
MESIAKLRMPPIRIAGAYDRALLLNGPHGAGEALRRPALAETPRSDVSAASTLSLSPVTPVCAWARERPYLC